MRESFDNVNDLFGFYEYIKLHLRGIRTFQPGHSFTVKSAHNILISQSIREEKLCFIGDVEKFVDQYYKIQPEWVPVPLDCLRTIFTFRFCHTLSAFRSLGHLALYFYKRIRKGERLPLRLKYKAHIGDIIDDMKEKAETYFIAKGYLLIPDSKTGD